MATKTKARAANDLLSELKRTRESLLGELSALSAKQQDVVFLGSWSARDLAAHLVGWDYTNLEAARHILAGKLPPFYAHRDRDWQTYNAMLVAEYSRDSLEELIALARESQGRLVEFLKSVPSEAFSKDFGVRFRGYKVTIQRLLEAEIGDERIHREQVRAFRKAKK